MTVVADEYQYSTQRTNVASFVFFEKDRAQVTAMLSEILIRDLHKIN